MIILNWFVYRIEIYLYAIVARLEPKLNESILNSIHIGIVFWLK